MTLIVNRLKNKLSDAAFVASSSEGSEIGLLPEDETQMLNDLANEAAELENEERSARTRYRRQHHTALSIPQRECKHPEQRSDARRRLLSTSDGDNDGEDELNLISRVSESKRAIGEREKVQFSTSSDINESEFDLDSEPIAPKRWKRA